MNPLLRFVTMFALLSVLPHCASHAPADSGAPPGDADAAMSTDAPVLDDVIAADITDVTDVSSPTDAAIDASSDVAYRGLYAVIRPVGMSLNAADTMALASPNISGALVRVPWNALETAPGTFDWTNFDARMNAVVSQGKVVELGILAGGFTPAWLFSATDLGGTAAVPYDFTFSPHQGASGTCAPPIALARPWDPVFLARWSMLLNAVAAHLATVPAMAAAVRVVKLTGINRDTEELRLPAETSMDVSCASDAPAQWVTAGYRPSLVHSAWVQIVSDFATAFPRAVFDVTIITSPNAFPPIDSTGTVVSAAAAPDVTTDLVNAAAAMLPTGRLVVESDFLMTGMTPAMKTIQLAMTDSLAIAFETNDYFAPVGAACNGAPGDAGACTNTTYLDELNEGIYPLGMSNPMRASFIEVFSGDVTAFATAMGTAQGELAP